MRDPLQYYEDEEEIAVTSPVVTSIAMRDVLKYLSTGPEITYIGRTAVTTLSLKQAVVSYTTGTPEPVGLTLTGVTSIKLQ